MSPQLHTFLALSRIRQLGQHVIVRHTNGRFPGETDCDSTMLVLVANPVTRYTTAESGQVNLFTTTHMPGQSVV